MAGKNGELTGLMQIKTSYAHDVLLLVTDFNKYLK